MEGLARLAKLNIPTVANLFIVLPELFWEFQPNNKIPSRALDELKTVFYSIKNQKDSITLRNSIYEKANPGLSFAVHNTLNIKSFDQFIKRIILGYKKAQRQAINTSKTEFCYLIQSFYSSEKCGLLLTCNGRGKIFIQAILGQHTKLILRGDIKPDEYLLAKKTYKILAKTIAQKQFRIKKLKAGIKKIRVKKADQNKPVISESQALQIAKLSQILERTFGPQEIEWAVLDNNKIIFQETRDLKQAKKIKFYKKADVIYPAKVCGKVINLASLPKRKTVSNKIVITANLNISFITKLAFLLRPKAVILTRGSLTSHAATILRESKITTVLINKIDFKDGDKIQIEKNGEIHKL